MFPAKIKPLQIGIELNFQYIRLKKEQQTNTSLALKFNPPWGFFKREQISKSNSLAHV